MRTFLNELFETSGKIISRYYHSQNFCVTKKSNDTPVTEADREAEHALRTLIKKKFPDHGIIGEEFGSENESAEYVWVLDPIDGTIAFIHGVPLFVTLIALLKNKQPIWGGIDQPIAQKRCIGDNHNAWLNDTSVAMRTVSETSDATLLATDIVNIHTLHNGPGFDKLLQQVKLFRTWGDGFGYLMLASGKADIMLDAKMAPWDILPVIPVVRGAGARITTFSGGDPVHGSSAVCAHPQLYEKIFPIVSSAHSCTKEK